VLALANSLAVGIEQDAARGALESGWLRASVVEASRLKERAAFSSYDSYERWRLLPKSAKAPDSSALDLCLFYKRGFLARKCLIRSDDRSKEELVFSRELASGRQHPPADRDLMARVSWGASQELRAHPLSKSTKPGSIRARCGIVFDDRTALAREHGYNVLVLLENVGDSSIEDEFCYEPFLCPAFYLFSSGPSGDRRIASQVWNGASVKERKDLVDAFLESEFAPRDKAEREAFRSRSIWVVRFRLDAREYTYQWFRVDGMDRDCPIRS
jgi:hypothetical protein